ncbi:hypothetical protein [uncultured Desulfovibrio sp.]|uniref:Uncharacterized protein n=1 Tax=Candidatus Desulfovibrio intestinavium TaxID=2838534 RepID=A0A9D2KRZ1_9BACT|nr:hypothetical protein [uncultured Desulfovibrio sp.]HJA78901.1 hypothetical protein [Candidatus Desulfovibrio intestinavium]
MNHLSHHLETVSNALEALARRNAAERPLLALAACHLRLLNLLGAAGGLPQAPLRAESSAAPGGRPCEPREGGHVLQ